jgi:tetratricopeptide (TPR) repeat protein
MFASYPPVRNRSACSTRAGVRTSPSRSGSSPTSIRSRLIRSCTLVFYIALFSASAHAQGLSAVAQRAEAGNPDALYRDREDIGKAQSAAEIWSSRLATNPRDFESAWKLARADYWLGTQGPVAARRPALERGTAAGRTASMIEPSRPEGFFWMAANMGALAESYGLRQGIKYRGAIKDALEKVLMIDPAFQKGSADRALGRWYFKVPGLFGGSKTKSVEHLQKSLTYDPNSTASHYFLAETLLEMDRKDEARAELQKVIDAPIDPEWAPEDRDFKEKARRLISLK